MIRVEVYGQQLGDEPVTRDVPGRPGATSRNSRSRPMPRTRRRRGQGPAQGRDAEFAVAFRNPYKRPPRTASPRTSRHDGDSARAQAGRPPTDQRVLIVRRIVLDGPYNPPPAVLPESAPADHGPRARPAAARGRPRDRRAGLPAGPSAARSSREEVDRLLALYDQAEKEGDRFEDCVRLALEGVLVWPHFLFRVELDPDPAQAGARAIRSTSTSWPAGCRISSGAACPTTSCSRWRRRAGCGEELDRPGAADAPATRSRRRSCRTSPASG